MGRPAIRTKEYNKAYQKEWRRLNQATQKLYHRELHLKRQYGISVAQYDELFAKQNGVCAICYRTSQEVGGKYPDRLNVDHDHQTQRIRGLLCSTCNLALGRLGDTVESFEKILVYLRGE